MNVRAPAGAVARVDPAGGGALALRSFGRQGGQERLCVVGVQPDSEHERALFGWMRARAGVASFERHRPGAIELRLAAASTRVSKAALARGAVGRGCGPMTAGQSAGSLDSTRRCRSPGEICDGS